MITLRGDLTDAAFARVVSDVTGADLPERGMVSGDGQEVLCWMSPDELLCITDFASVPERLARFEAGFEGQFAMAVDVSDARAMFQVSGPHARDVLAKLAPVDLAPGQFEPPMFRRTRLAQVAAAFWMAGPDQFCIVSFRSHAQYVWDVLNVAAQPGSEIDALP
jgi:sarcosine oxidase subunit gamma